jgi:transposase
MRARIVLIAGDGVSNSAIARELGVSRPTMILWRERFAAALAGLGR